MAKSKKRKQSRLKHLPASKIKKVKKKTPAFQPHAGDKQPGAPSKKKKNGKASQDQAVPYSANDCILLLGEANFSFTVSLVALLRRDVQGGNVETGSHAHLDGNEEGVFDDDDDDDDLGRDKPFLADLPAAAAKLVATTFDSREVTFQKYPDAEDNVASLERAGVTVMFRVDATRLGSHRAAFLRAGVQAFDKIVFNFPHVGLGIKDQDRNVLANQQLLHGFFASVVESRLIGPRSEVHVTLKTGLPYDLWAVKAMAQGYLVTQTSFVFHPSLYPGYSHRRTLGYREGLSAASNEELAGKECRTYVFQLPQVQPKATKRKRRRNESNDDSD